VIKRQCSVN